MLLDFLIVSSPWIPQCVSTFSGLFKTNFHAFLTRNECSNVPLSFYHTVWWLIDVDCVATSACRGPKFIKFKDVTRCRRNRKLFLQYIHQSANAPYSGSWGGGTTGRRCLSNATRERILRENCAKQHRDINAKAKRKDGPLNEKLGFRHSAPTGTCSSRTSTKPSIGCHAKNIPTYLYWPRLSPDVSLGWSCCFEV